MVINQVGRKEETSCELTSAVIKRNTERYSVYWQGLDQQSLTVSLELCVH